MKSLVQEPKNLHVPEEDEQIDKYVFENSVVTQLALPELSYVKYIIELAALPLISVRLLTIQCCCYQPRG